MHSLSSFSHSFPTTWEYLDVMTTETGTVLSHCHCSPEKSEKMAAYVVKRAQDRPQCVSDVVQVALQDRRTVPAFGLGSEHKHSVFCLPIFKKLGTLKFSSGIIEPSSAAVVDISPNIWPTSGSIFPIKFVVVGFLLLNSLSKDPCGLA
jgi:hypothetical protein